MNKRATPPKKTPPVVKKSSSRAWELFTVKVRLVLLDQLSLTMAQRKKARRKPYTQQAIVEEALMKWLDENG
jgi:hypothetical protein